MNIFHPHIEFYYYFLLILCLAIITVLKTPLTLANLLRTPVPILITAILSPLSQMCEKKGKKIMHIHIAMNSHS